MTDTSLDNRIALVTGASRGIGKAIALALAAAGCHVAVNYVSREADACKTADAIQALGRRALVAKGDVSKSADVAALVAAVEARLGPVDVLVNNAGRAAFESIEQMTEASWNECMQLNLTSVFLLTQRKVVWVITELDRQTTTVLLPCEFAGRKRSTRLKHTPPARRIASADRALPSTDRGSDEPV